METPQFNSDEEFFAWTFKKISESITNLAQRMETVEEGIGKIPPPGPDMVKYKPPGSPAYLNLKELLDLIFKIMQDQEKRWVDVEDIASKIEAQLQQRLNLEIAEQVADKMEAIEVRLNKIEDKLSD
tara:strand:+ start:60 stop:440 length:381 start_codon:yes stop_codon:yes gene_type:complete